RMHTSNPVLTVSRLLGVAPPKRSGLIRWICRIWSMSLLCYIWAGSIWKCMDFKAEIPTVEKILFLTEFPGNMLAIGFLVWYAIQNTFPSQKAELQIDRLVKELDSKAAKHIYCKHCRVHLQLLIIVIAFHGLCVLVDMVTFNFGWRETSFSNSVYNLPALMMSLGVLQYVQPVKNLWFCLEHVRSRLQEVKMRQRSPLGTTKLNARYESAFAILVDAGGQTASLLEDMRSMCNQIDRLHKLLLRKFGIFLLLNFANSLASVCVELYLVFNFFENPLWEESVLFLYRILWLIMHGGRIWLILAVNGGILEQKCLLCQLLNELVVCSSHLERTINRFLRQLQNGLNHPPTACGIVPLDTLELGGFIGVLMAIVIFLIQIGLGNKSLMGVALNRSNWVYV
ncbi:hypothetical protein KR018_004224, partial [Drosophila ironensis]